MKLAKIIAVGTTPSDRCATLFRLSELRFLSQTIHQLFFAADVVSKFPLSNPAPFAVSDTESISTHYYFEPAIHELTHYLSRPVISELPDRIQWAKAICVHFCRFLKSRLDYLAPQFNAQHPSGGDAAHRRFSLPSEWPSFDVLSRRIEGVMSEICDHSFSFDKKSEALLNQLSCFSDPKFFDSLSIKGVEAATDREDLKQMIYYPSHDSLINGLAVVAGLDNSNVSLISAISVAVGDDLLERLPNFVEQYCKDVAGTIGFSDQELGILKKLLEAKISTFSSSAANSDFDSLLNKIPEGHHAYFVFVGLSQLVYYLHLVRQVRMEEFFGFLHISDTIRQDDRFSCPKPKSCSEMRDVALDLHRIGEYWESVRVKSFVS